jgi:hypothetical protein
MGVVVLGMMRIEEFADDSHSPGDLPDSGVKREAARRV